MAQGWPASVPLPVAVFRQQHARAVGIVIANSQNFVLAGQRTKTPNIWGCLQVDGQGGDRNESKDLDTAVGFAHGVYGLHCGVHITFVASAVVAASDEARTELAEGSEDGQEAAVAEDV